MRALSENVYYWQS